MFTRVTGFLIVPLWLASMGWLVVHDVWPGLTAQEVPPVVVSEWLTGQGAQSQYAIEGDMGRLGTLWTTYMADEASVLREDIVWIEQLPVPLAPLRVNARSTYTHKGVLDELSMTVQCDRTRMRLNGERFHADFSFTFECGTVHKAFKVPLARGRMISGAFNPFSQLVDLHVGQTWRMQVFNPVASIMGVGERFMPMLVKVTGEQRISTGAWEGNCMVVEAGDAKAWVDAHGVVQLQTVNLPGMGELRIVHEPEFDAAARARASRHEFKRPGR